MTPDQPISLIFVVVGGLLVLALPRRYALVPLAVSMCWHPSTLLLPPTQLSLTAQRVIAVLLLLRCAISSDIRSRFKWKLVDTAALVYFLLLLASQMLSTPIGPALNNRAGFLLSAMVPFWCARFLVTDRESLYALLKGLLWAALPLAVLGWYEMQTTYNPWDTVRQYGNVKAPRGSDGWRLFMGSIHARARGPFLQYIMFGWFFALLIALGTNLYFQKRRVDWWIVPWVVLPVGVVSSIASGPMTLAVCAVALSSLFPLRKHWRIGFWTAAGLFGAAYLYSNRSLMELIAQFGFDPHSSWYRVKLVRFTLDQGGMSGHWLVGYGEIPPNYGEYHDLCIHWVWLLVVHGMLGVVGFYGLIAAVGRQIWKAKAQAESVEDQWLLWTMMSTLLASLAAMLVVALFSETYFIYHMLLGVMANAVVLVGGTGKCVGMLGQVDGRTVLLRFHLKAGQRLAVVPVKSG